MPALSIAAVTARYRADRPTLSAVTGKRSQVRNPPGRTSAGRAGRSGRPSRRCCRTALIRERRSRRRWVPLVAGILTFLLGLRDILLVVRPHVWERVRVIDRVLPGRVNPAVVHGVVGATLVVAGALLILLSHALRRRKRRAWRAVVAILVLTVLLHVMHGPDTLVRRHRLAAPRPRAADCA